MARLAHTIKNLIKIPIEKLSAQYGPHQRSGGNKLWILMYHRILPQSDPRYSKEEPGMIVEPETFLEHINQLKQLFTILPLSEWIHRSQMGQPLPDNACAITFDDGWADNYEYAFPIIQEQQIPTTLFAVSHMIGTNRQFWPNRLAELLKTATAEQLLSLPWLSTLVPPTAETTFNKELLSSIVNQLKVNPDHLIHEWLANAEQQLDIEPATDQALVNWQQLKEMSDSGLVEIGSHTCNHTRLQDNLDHQIIESEIAASQLRLQEELNQPIDLFCYPNGDVSPAALAAVRKHYKAAVTTQRGINSGANNDHHQLLRIGVHQDISNTSNRFQARLANWF